MFITRAAKTPAVIIAALHPANTEHEVRLGIQMKGVARTNDRGVGGGIEITGKHYWWQCHRPTFIVRVRFARVMPHWEYADATTPKEDTSVLVINQLIGKSASYGGLRNVYLQSY